MENFTHILRQTCLETPGKIALTLLHSGHPPRALTYMDLAYKALQYCEAMRQAGVGPGEVAILILKHGEDLIASFWGAVLNGSIPSIMPFLTEKLLPEQYRTSLIALFKITAPAAVIVDPDNTTDVVEASQGTSVRVILDWRQIGESRSQPTAIDWGNLPGLHCSKDEIVLLQHSSGSTGLQKGVALSHLAVINQLDSYGMALLLDDNDVIVSWLPLYHDMGLIAGFILPILRRVPLVLMSPFDWVRAPHRLMQAISQYRGTLCWLPNFAYNFCAQKIRQRDLDGIDLSSLRAVINCSEPMYWLSHKMFLQRFQAYGLKASALATCYAMAENVFAVTQGGIESPVVIDTINYQTLLQEQHATPVGNSLHGYPEEFSPASHKMPMLSAGRPISGVKVRICDPTGKDLPERRVGEIVIKSDCMLTGYYHRTDVTRQAFRDGWYLTGDLGYLADGELYVTGRKKDLIIVGGKNIYPQDLEQLAGQVNGVHPGRVVAFGVFDEKAGTEEVVIVVEAESGLEFNDQTTSEFEELAERISNDVRQRVNRGSDIAVRRVQVVQRNWLVKTSSGKIARQANKNKYLAEFTEPTQDD